MKRVVIIIAFFSLTAYAQIDQAQFKSWHKKAKIQNYEISYVDHGEGKPIVLFHGIPTSSWMYRNLIPKLASLGYRVIAPDMLGMGASQANDVPNDSLSLENQSKILSELITNKLGIKHFSAIVHDFGGPILWDMLGHSEVTIDNMIILNTFAFKEGWNHGYNFMTRSLMSIATTPLTDKMFFQSAIRSMIENPKRFEQDELKSIIEGYVKPLTQGAGRTYKVLYYSVKSIENNMLSKFQQNLLKIDPKTITLIWGENDKFLSSNEQVTQFKNHLQLNSDQIYIINEAKHLILEDQFEQIYKIIKDKL